MKPKAMIAMSGGVDSSVAAYLAMQDGFDCTGVTMKLLTEDHHAEPDHDKTCCSMEDTLDAKSVARLLGIPHYTFNFTDAFSEKVIRPFVNAYVAGTTPNPCIECNRFIKFDRLMQRAHLLDFDALITGHYARIDEAPNGRMLLRMAEDRNKDQSYFLYTLTQEQLRHTRFPLGAITKKDARELAAELGLSTANKCDSQDICFVPDGDYAAFIEHYIGTEAIPGDFVGTDGQKLGTHRGIFRYTIGQRRGLGLTLPRRQYVCATSTETNTVTLGDEQSLYSRRLVARDINMIPLEQLTCDYRVHAKIRYGQEAQLATVHQTGPDTLVVDFDLPQRAVAKGQAIVLYSDDVVLGGGTIT